MYIFTVIIDNNGVNLFSDMYGTYLLEYSIIENVDCIIWEKKRD